MDVSIRCVCPLKADEVRHPDGDTVTLRDTLGFVATQTARNAVILAKGEALDEGIPLGGALALALLTEQYLLLGIESWTLVDEKGKPVPVTRGSIRAFFDDEDHDDVATVVSDACDLLYAKKVMLPLLQTASTSSPVTPTASTSPTRGNGATPRRKRSSRSLTTTTPTDDIETTSKLPVGDSSSSPKLASVA